MEAPVCSLFPPKKRVLDGGWLQAGSSHFNEKYSLLQDDTVENIATINAQTWLTWDDKKIDTQLKKQAATRDPIQGFI